MLYSKPGVPEPTVLMSRTTDRSPRKRRGERQFRGPTWTLLGEADMETMGSKSVHRGAALAALIVATCVLGGRLGSARAADITLQGTGATFPAPLYQRWFTEYNKMHPEVQINYQALGSGAGVKQFQDGLVNFGASDAAMTDEEMSVVKRGVVLLPMTAGSIVLGYNLPGGPKELNLSGRPIPASSSARSPSGTTRRSPRRTRA